MFSLGKRNIFLKKLAIKGKKKHAVRRRNYRVCPLRAGFMDVCPVQSHRTQHLEAHDLMPCRGHLGILNNLSSGGPRFPFFTEPSALYSFPAPTCLWRLCSASLLHNSDSPQPLLLFPREPHCQGLVSMSKLILNVDQVCIINSASDIQLPVDSCGQLEYCYTTCFFYLTILKTHFYISKYCLPCSSLYQ